MSFLAKVINWCKWLLASVLTLLAALWQLVGLRIHQVRLAEKMDGPRAYPLIGNALGPKSLSARDLFVWFVNLIEEYGPSCRFYLGPMLFVYTKDTKDLEDILSGQKYIEKNFVYRFARSWIGTGLITSGGEKWRSRRKLLTPAFHFKILEQFVPVYNSCGDEFVRQMRTRADDRVLDVYPYVQLLTLDVICESSMGVKINAQVDSNSTYVQALKKVMVMTGLRIFQPWYYPNFVFMNSPTGREYKRMLKIIHGTTDRVIQERKAELETMNRENITLHADEIGRRRRVAFLDLLLLSAKEGSLSDQDIREEVDTFMFAGHDTTAAAISFTIFLLSRHPDVQDNIFSELESVFDPQQPLQPSLQELSELKYLEMVLKESLRIYPPVPQINRWNPEDTKLSSGHTMPAGCSISIVPFTTHRDPESFPDPESFIPERFSPEESARRHPYALQRRPSQLHRSAICNAGAQERAGEGRVEFSHSPGPGFRT